MFPISKSLSVKYCFLLFLLSLSSDDLFPCKFVISEIKLSNFIGEHHWRHEMNLRRPKITISFIFHIRFFFNWNQIETVSLSCRLMRRIVRGYLFSLQIFILHTSSYSRKKFCFDCLCLFACLFIYYRYTLV